MEAYKISYQAVSIFQRLGEACGQKSLRQNASPEEEEEIPDGTTLHIPIEVDDDTVQSMIRLWESDDLNYFLLAIRFAVQYAEEKGMFIFPLAPITSETRCVEDTRVVTAILKYDLAFIKAIHPPSGDFDFDTAMFLTYEVFPGSPFELKKQIHKLLKQYAKCNLFVKEYIGLTLLIIPDAEPSKMVKLLLSIADILQTSSIPETLIRTVDNALTEKVKGIDLEQSAETICKYLTESFDEVICLDLRNFRIEQ